MRSHTGTDALDVRYATLDDCERATGLVVVVDVIRAFTTAAHVLDRGATEIWPVADVDEDVACADYLSALLRGEAPRSHELPATPAGLDRWPPLHRRGPPGGSWP